MPSLIKVSCGFVCLLSFVVVISAATGTQWINLREESAIFTDVSFNCKYNTVLTATNLDFPLFASAYDPKNGTHKWVSTATKAQTIRVETASHRYDTSKDLDGSSVEVLIGQLDQFTSDGLAAFTLLGLTITGKQIWKTTIPINGMLGYLDIEDDQFFTISDDASLAAFVMINGDMNQTQWFVLDASSGKQLWNMTDDTLQGSFLQFSQDNTVIFWEKMGAIYSYDARTGMPHAMPIPMPHDLPSNMPYSFAAYKNGDDDFVVAGNVVLQAHKYDPSSGTYQMLWEVDRIKANEFMSDVTIAKVQDKIYVANSWDPMQFNHIKIEMRDISSSTPVWTYTSKTSGGLEDDVSEIMFDPSGYLAISTWGDETHTTPQVILFDVNSDTPVWSAGTPGSMFSADLCYDGELVWVGAAGKHAHANVFASGGDFFTWSVSP